MPPMTDNNNLPLRIRGAHGAEEMSWVSVLQIVAIAAMLVGIAVISACAAIATTPHP